MAGEDVVLFVNGTLLADGTPNSPIIITSYRDDTVGGDSNNDVNSAGRWGDWGNIQFGGTSTGNLMDHVEVRYPGYVYSWMDDPAIVVSGGQLQLTNSLISDTSRNGVTIQSGATVSLLNNVIVESHYQILLPTSNRETLAKQAFWDSHWESKS